jgi:hypothetical protein
LERGSNVCSEQLLQQIRSELEKNKARFFILQMNVADAGAEKLLTFRTLAGSVAASFMWNFEPSHRDLLEAVIKEMKSSGFQVPFERLRPTHLRIVDMNGQLLSEEAIQGGCSPQWSFGF